MRLLLMLVLSACLTFKTVDFRSTQGPYKSTNEIDLIQQFLLFDMDGKVMRSQLYIPSLDFLHKEKTDEIIFSTALNVTKCIGKGCKTKRLVYIYKVAF